jgi:SAM-dependent methyltransferase
MKDREDAFGHEVYDYLEGENEHEIVERDDGYITVTNAPRLYFAGYDDWPAHDQEAMRHVAGRVLDIGCGAGRHCLYLQEQGLDVLGIDISPLAVEVCKRRGVKQAAVVPITRAGRSLGTFDTLLLLGHNIGLLGDYTRAQWLLRRFHAMTGEHALIVGASRDPYATTDPFHLAYHERNRKRGRMAGQIRLRVRYKTYASPWFDYLFVSRTELEHILQGTGWRVNSYVDAAGGSYIAIIGKEGA